MLVKRGPNMVWIAIFGAFMLAVFFANPDGSDHRRPATAEVAGPAEPGVAPLPGEAPMIYKKN